MNERAVPFHCPYCGDEDLRPAERTEKVPGAAWWCASCLRTFVVTFVGIGVPDSPQSTGAERSASRPSGAREPERSEGAR